MARFSLHAAGLLALCILASGCLLGSSTETVSYGQIVAADTLSRVEAGAGAEEVRALLGEPTSVTETEGGELWKYEYKKKETRKGTILLLLSSSHTTESNHAVFVSFQAGQVVKTWRE